MVTTSKFGLLMISQHSATRKHLYSQAKKGEAATLITATTSIHLPKLVSADLTIKSDLVLTNQIGKDEVQAGQCNKTSTP